MVILKTLEISAKMLDVRCEGNLNRSGHTVHEDSNLLHNEAGNAFAEISLYNSNIYGEKSNGHKIR